MEISTLLDACRDIMADQTIVKRYPHGMTAADILGNIHVKFGRDAFPYVSVIDVCDEMSNFFGKGIGYASTSQT